MFKRLIVAWLTGVLFALGLMVSGMTNAYKVRGFLDVTRHWDPTLLFVMASAVLIYAMAYLDAKSMKKPVFAEHFDIPTNRTIDAKLILGATLFGIGWGMLGMCPGPALVSLVTLSKTSVLFAVGLLVGMFSHNFVKPR